MTTNELKACNASFGTIMNFGRVGFSEYAVMPYGGAYLLSDDKKSWLPLNGTNDCYDLSGLRARLFDWNRLNNQFSQDLDTVEILHP